MKFFKNRLFWAIAPIAVILDQLTKFWVVGVFDYGETWPLWPGIFHFTFVTNTGAAFSLFQGSGWLRWLSLLVSLVLIAWGWFGPRLSAWEQTGYGLILGGAIGNGIDRFATGEVIDFLDFRLIRFPVFNLADVSINLGIACLLVVMFWQAQHGEGEKRSPDPESADRSDSSSD